MASQENRIGLYSLGRIFAGAFRSKGGKACGMHAICGLLQLPRSLEMAKRIKTQTYTSEDFEAKAQELIHMAFTISEERIYAAPHLRSPIGNALAEGAMTVKYALRAFLAVSRIQDK